MGMFQAIVLSEFSPKDLIYRINKCSKLIDNKADYIPLIKLSRHKICELFNDENLSHYNKTKYTFDDGAFIELNNECNRSLLINSDYHVYLLYDRSQ